jgi:outer membrane immunogenic protein
MRDSFSGGLMVGALALLLVLSAPNSTDAQEKKDSSTGPNATETGESLVPRSETVAKPDVPAPPPATSYDWTGGYIGGHLGWGKGRADTSITPLPTATSFIDLRPTTLRPEPSGFNAGLQGGYNWQTGHFVVGAEADLSSSRMSGTARVTPIIMNNGSAFPGAGFLIARQDTDWFGTLRPRAGMAFGRVLVYGTGGLAFGRVDYSANVDFRPGTPTPILFFRYPASFTKTKTGWTAGGGVEVAINRHWSWKAEYLYYDLRKESSTANPVPANPPFQVAYTWETKAHTFNAGINFRF